MRVSLAMAVAVSVLALIASNAQAGCCHSGYRYSGYYFVSPYHPPPPASNFSAYYYQSPGGIRGAERGVSRLQYPRPCGGGRVWDGERDLCVNR